MDKLNIQLHASRQLAALLGLAHCAAVGAIWPTALPVLLKIGMTLLLAGSLYYNFRQFAWLNSPQAIVKLQLSGRNGCRVSLLTNDHLDCRIDGNTFVASYMVVLCLQAEHAVWRRTIIILPDAIDAEAFRRLRVWLRWKWRDVGD